MKEQLTKAITSTVEAWQNLTSDEDYGQINVDNGNVEQFIKEVVSSAMDSLHEPVMASPCCLDYEREYYTMCERFKELQEEKEKLNQALINVACKLK